MRVAFSIAATLIASPALAQVGDQRSGITYGEAGWIVGLIAAVVIFTLGAREWISKRNSKTHERIDVMAAEITKQFAALSSQTNERELGFVQNMTTEKQAIDARVHSIELLLANKYVDKNDLHDAVKEIRADIRTVHDRLNKESPAAGSAH